MEYTVWLFPAAVIVLKVLMKLFVFAHPSVPEGITIALGVPFDVAFLSATLLAGGAVADHGNAGKYFGWFTLTIGLAIIAMVLGRTTESRFAEERWVSLVAFGLVNFALTLTAASFAVSYVSRVAPS